MNKSFPAIMTQKISTGLRDGKTVYIPLPENITVKSAGIDINKLSDDDWSYLEALSVCGLMFIVHYSRTGFVITKLSLDGGVRPTEVFYPKKARLGRTQYKAIRGIVLDVFQDNKRTSYLNTILNTNLLMTISDSTGNPKTVDKLSDLLSKFTIKGDQNE